MPNSCGRLLPLKPVSSRAHGARSEMPAPGAERPACRGYPNRRGAVRPESDDHGWQEPAPAVARVSRRPRADTSFARDPRLARDWLLLPNRRGAARRRGRHFSCVLRAGPHLTRLIRCDAATRSPLVSDSFQGPTGGGVYGARRRVSPRRASARTADVDFAGPRSCRG